MVSNFYNLSHRCFQSLRRLKATILIFLLASVILSGIILAYDGLLWLDNPKTGHAYGLIFLVVVDVIFIASLPLAPARRRLYSALTFWVGLKILLLLLNPLTGPQIGISPSEFAAYLFGLAPISSPECPLECPPLRFTYLILLLVHIPLLYGSARLRKKV